MIVVEGKNYFTFLEASQETGYTVYSIRTYVSKKAKLDHIVDVNIEPPVTLQPEPDSIELQDALPAKTYPEKLIHFRGPENLDLYARIETLAKMKNISPLQYCMQALSAAVEEKENIIKQIEQLEQQKAKLMEQL